ncbi:MAG: helix-turn-helix domain-containing protein [Chloroflexi bacterium]|nr:helix-turn-helix domain-containing protein [Chloroflexota bacterium]
MTMTTARQKVLAYLKKNRLASAQEIARALHVTPANARHHLRILAADGRVTVVSAGGEGRGRPVKHYGLSAALAGDQLPALLGAVLDEWLGGLSPSKREQALRSLAERMGGTLQSESAPLMRRLASAVERLNQLHYQARWEAGAEGPRILLGPCPYAKVIAAHLELCTMDTALLEILLERPILQVQRNETTMQGLCPFLFQIG